MAPDLIVADADALDCSVCYLPLKPPIFQCDVGHVVCAPCRDKLNGKGNCHACGVAMAGGYRRCHAMERVVDSVLAPCPNAAYGCTAMPPYHGRVEHVKACPYAPWRCPGEACGFAAGSTAELLDHFLAAHSWPCNPEVKADFFGKYTVRLHDGFNFLLADGKKVPPGASCATATETVRCLLLLNVVRQQLGRGTISVICIDPHAGGCQGPASKETICTLSYSGCVDKLSHHYQVSTFRLECTDLSNGMPAPDGCFQCPVPNSVVGDIDKDNIEVTVRIFIE